LKLAFWDFVSGLLRKCFHFDQLRLI
jgi:hypothetical protein